MRKQRNNKGQAMVEYIIIVVLIAIALIAIVGVFGKAIAEKFSGASKAIGSSEIATEADDTFKAYNTDSIKEIQ